MLAALEVLRDELERPLRAVPDDVAVVLHPRPAALALAHPWLPLAAARRGARGAALLRRLVQRVRHPRARAAGAREARVRRPGLARGAAAQPPARVRPPGGRRQQPLPAAAVLARRTFRRYVRWAWLCEGAATWLSGQTPAAAGGDRAPPARGRPPGVPARAARRDAARRHRLRRCWKSEHGRPSGGGARAPATSSAARAPSWSMPSAASSPASRATGASCLDVAGG